MFKSKKEFALALLEGRKFTYNNDIFVFNPELECSPFRVLRGGYHALNDSWDFFDKVTEIVKPKWLDNIPPKGILCWVSYNDIKCRTRLAVITGTTTNNPSYIKFIDTDSNKWPFATPLTKADFYQHSLEDPSCVN